MVQAAIESTRQRGTTVIGLRHIQCRHGLRPGQEPLRDDRRDHQAQQRPVHRCRSRRRVPRAIHCQQLEAALESGGGWALQLLGEMTGGASVVDRSGYPYLRC